MDTFHLTELPFEPDLSALAEHLHVSPESPDAAQLEAMLAQAQTVARPRALYRVAYITDRGEDWVAVDGIRLTSRVLAVNLADVHRFFAYAATCGPELETWAETCDDLLLRYWADAIMTRALRAAITAVKNHIGEVHRPGPTSSMNPGSLEDWPLDQQVPLFALLGDVQAATGIELLDTYLMRPIKSVSGIRFAREDSFESCQLCPRADCPGRRAPYDNTLYERRYSS